jgi:hypothetical protein
MAAVLPDQLSRNELMQLGLQFLDDLTALTMKPLYMIDRQPLPSSPPLTFVGKWVGSTLRP